MWRLGELADRALHENGDAIGQPRRNRTAGVREQVSFEPERTQIRFLRQGINSRPFWIVSLSIPGETENTFKQIAVVRVDANNGKVEDVERGRPVSAGE